MNIVAFSDTHGYHEALTNDILNIQKTEIIDVLICCGDFSNTKKSFWEFINWFAQFNCKYKIIVGGNHDAYLSKESKILEKTLLDNFDIICLNDTHITIDNIKFYGTPYFSMPYYNFHYRDSNETLKILKSLNDIDVLITHAPPYCTLDKTIDRQNVGDVALKEFLSHNKSVKYHIFGHIHESFGNVIHKSKHYFNVAILNSNKLNNVTTIKI